MSRVLIVCTTDSMIWNFLVPHIKNLTDNGYDVECACSITGYFYKKLQELYGLSMHQVDFARSPYSMRNVRAFMQLCCLMKRNKYDIVFCHEPVGGAMGRIVGHLYKATVVYMAHGFHFYKGAPKSAVIYYYIEKFLARYTDVLITINKEDYDVAKKFYTKEKCLLNGIGVDTSRFVHKAKSDYLFQELNINKEETVLLSVGELIKRKNHETMIRAIEEIKRPDIHYVIAGDGELEDYYRDLIIQLGLNNVHLLGYRTDVNELCNAADIFVIPSYQEGLSVALMEAMACGLPVIASRIRGNVDLIQNDVGGILVGVDELSEYKEAIIKLANNKKLRKNMGYSNIDRVKQFDILSVEKQLLSVFESL